MAKRFRYMPLDGRRYEAEYTYLFRINTPAPGWRAWLACQLRRAAQRLDGLYSLAVEIDTTPPLSNRSKKQAVQFGIQMMERAVVQEARDAAIEQALATTYPELQPHGQD